MSAPKTVEQAYENGWNCDTYFLIDATPALAMAIKKYLHDGNSCQVLRIILSTLATIPLIALSVLETVVRGALILPVAILSPFYFLITSCFSISCRVAAGYFIAHLTVWTFSTILMLQHDLICVFWLLKYNFFTKPLLYDDLTSECLKQTVEFVMSASSRSQPPSQ
jgi:hypothetical protein